MIVERRSKRQKVMAAGLAMVLLAAQRPGLAAAAGNPGNPCQDPLYLDLKQKKLDAMSEREYAYFQQKSAECASIQQGKQLSEDINGGKTGQALQATTNGLWIVVGILTIGSLIAISSTHVSMLGTRGRPAFRFGGGAR